MATRDFKMCWASNGEKQKIKCSQVCFKSPGDFLRNLRCGVRRSENEWTKARNPSKFTHDT